MDADEAPTDITADVGDNNIAIAENTGATNLATFTAVDVDLNQTHVFSIGLGFDNNFTMSTGGVLATISAFDREAIPGGTISLNVTAMGQQYTSDPTYGLNVPGLQSLTKSFTITVTDVNEAPQYGSAT